MKKEKGFSLLEVMIALVIFSIGALGAAKLMTLSTTYTSAAFGVTEASVFCQSKFEELKVLSPSSIKDGQDTITGSTGKVYTLTWTVNESTFNPYTCPEKLRVVNLQANWEDSMKHEVKFTYALSSIQAIGYGSWAKNMY